MRVTSPFCYSYSAIWSKQRKIILFRYRQSVRHLLWVLFEEVTQALRVYITKPRPNRDTNLVAFENFLCSQLRGRLDDGSRPDPILDQRIQPVTLPAVHGPPVGVNQRTLQVHPIPQLILVPLEQSRHIRLPRVCMQLVNGECVTSSLMF